MPRRALAICLIAAFAGLSHGVGILRPLNDLLTELRFDAFPRAPTREIVVVDIDAKSIATLGAWPWPRRVHADLIRALGRLGSSEIALDVDFSTRSNDADDGALETALRDAKGSVILAAFNQRSTASARDEGVVANRPLDRFLKFSWPASVNVQADPDGRVRRYPFGNLIEGELLPSLASLYGNVPPADTSFVIDFSIAPTEIDRISAIDLLQARVDAQRLNGKKVIVGASAIELRDFFQVPKHGLITGALLQAIGAETILQGRMLEETGQGIAIAGLALIGLFVLLMGRLEWRIVLLGLAVMAAMIEAAAFVLQAWRPVVLDTSAWHVACLGYMALTTGREIDLRRILIAIVRTEKQNVQTVLDQVIADSFDGIVVADDRGIIQSASRSAGAILLGRGSGDWKGRSLTDLVPADLAAAMMEAASACAAGACQEAAPRELSLNNHAAGERILEYTMTPSRLEGGLTDGGTARRDRFVVCLRFRDITDRRLAERRLEYLARFDTLTGLPNRNDFMERLERFLEADDAARSSGAVLYFDLDRFKNINDTFGHGTGDLLLHAVAHRSLELLPPPHVVSRFGGDEFAALWTGPTGTDELGFVAQRLIDHLSEPYEINGNRLSVGASVGIMALEGAGRDAPLIMKNADTALYRAKKDGGGSYCFYDAAMEIALRARQRLEMDLRDALSRQELTVFYQPQFELSSGCLIGVEALLRWRHPERGFVSPAEFIPVAEEIGLMETLGEWVLHEACRQAAQWPGAIKVAVNVSPLQFSRGDMVKTVASALARSGLPARQLELEITESLFIQENASIRSCMDEIKACGVDFALDDFGTGYSSLRYLRAFPIDKIKIDRSFVLGVPHDREAMAIVQAVVALAGNLGIRVNAEGLETTEQIEALQRLGCNEGQGFGLGRPQPADMLVGLLDQGSCERTRPCIRG